jgi:hypothetical protein
VSEVKAGVVLAVGIVLAGLSGCIWLWLGSDRAVCSNSLVSALAPQQCGTVADWSAVTIVGFLAGLGVIAWGLVIANRKPRP